MDAFWKAWAWVHSHLWHPIVGAIFLLGAMGGAVLWFYQIRKLRREEKERQRESEIQKYYKKLEDIESGMQRGSSTSVTLMDPRPEPGEDAELLAEAWKRFQKDKKAGKSTGSSTWRPSRF